MSEQNAAAAEQPAQETAESAAHDHDETLLRLEEEESFPASDPPANY